jgi:hypothetical protein
VPAPGALLYTPEWQACRAGCAAGEPGCYTRVKHFYVTGAAPSAADGGVGAAGGGARPADGSEGPTARGQQGGAEAAPRPRWRLPAPSSRRGA